MSVTLNDVITNRIDKKVNYGKARTNFDSEKGPNMNLLLVLFLILHITYG